MEYFRDKFYFLIFCFIINEYVMDTHYKFAVGVTKQCNEMIPEPKIWHVTLLDHAEGN